MNSKNAGYGKYYPEVDTHTTLTLRGFAKHMSDHGSIYGLDPNNVVKGVHIRFLPYGVEDENITSRRFKEEYCSLEFRNIIDTQEVTVDGKKKKVTTLKPIATAIAEYKAAAPEPRSATAREGYRCGCSADRVVALHPEGRTLLRHIFHFPCQRLIFLMTLSSVVYLLAINDVHTP